MSCARACAAVLFEVHPADIEKEDDGYVLRDVFCADGQFEIRLDAMFRVIAKTPG